MSEIKFRAWDKEKKRMYADVGIFPFPWNERTQNSSWSFSADGTTVNPYHENIALMQYADLEDKNGGEYCQNDIFVDSRNGDRYQVVREFGAFWADPIDFDQMCESYCRVLLCHINVLSEIIGNIHENPELLKG